MKNFDRKENTFHIFAQNSECGYTLEPPRAKIRKNSFTPIYPSIAIYKWGLRGGIYFMDMFS